MNIIMLTIIIIEYSFLLKIMGQDRPQGLTRHQPSMIVILLFRNTMLVILPYSQITSKSKQLMFSFRFNFFHILLFLVQTPGLRSTMSSKRACQIYILGCMYNYTYSQVFFLRTYNKNSIICGYIHNDISLLMYSIK